MTIQESSVAALSIDHSPAAHWSLASWALVKSTGFPFELLEQLRTGDVASAACADDQAVTETIDACVARLIEICSDERFLEAVMLSSRSAYEQLHRWLARPPGTATGFRSDDRRKVLLAAMYLQRMCAKNESTSFFGPVYWAQVRSGEELVLDIGEPARPRTRVYWTHWAAQAVADVMSTDPEVLARLVPSAPHHLVRRGGQYLAVSFGDWPITVAELEPPAAGTLASRLLARCDGHADVASLARAENVDVTDAVPALDELDRRGLVRFRLRIPVGVIDPLRALRDSAAVRQLSADSRWHAVLDALDLRISAFHDAGSLPARRGALSDVLSAFTAVTGVAGEKDAGRHYADRCAVVEDGHFPWSGFTIGEPMHNYLRTEMPVVLDLLFELSLARRRRRVQLITQWFIGAFGRRSVPLDRVLAVANASGLGPRLRSLDDLTLASGPSALTDVLLANTGRSRVHLTMDWARARAADVDFDTWCVAGADLLVDAPDLASVSAGAYQVVVGEVHGLHDQLLQGLWPALHPSRGEFEAEVGELIGGLTDGRICDPVLTHWRKTLARSEVLPEIEFIGDSTRAGSDVGRAADLLVSAESGCLTLECPTLGRAYLTRPPLLSWGDEVESVFAPFTGARLIGAEDMFRALDQVDHLPRLTVGRTVVHRETWRIQGAGRASWSSLSAGNQRHVRQLRDRHGFPDQVYVKFPGEPKPVFVDFATPVLVDLFSRHYARAAGPVTVCEMLPDGSGLWLRDHAGRHTSELRFGYYRRPSGMGT